MLIKYCWFKGMVRLVYSIPTRKTRTLESHYLSYSSSQTAAVVANLNARKKGWGFVLFLGRF